jgi:hypothetical protein
LKILFSFVFLLQHKNPIFASHTVPDKTGLKGNPVKIGSYPRSCKFPGGKLEFSSGSRVENNPCHW